MGIDLEEAIKYSKDILLNSNFFDKVSFSRYSKVFFAASENIRAYLDQERFNKSRALTVLSGGDHVFNLISHGVKEIDAFDINYLTYFVYKLRLAMIRGLSYQDFIQANYDFSFSGHLNNCDNMINFLKRYLDEDVYGYYKKMIEFSRSADIPLPILYYMPRTCFKSMQSYLESEEAFLILKSQLEEAKVNLFFGDARSLPDSLSGNYDIILLSNIADYFGTKFHLLDLADFKSFILMYGNLLNEEGLLINYLYRLEHICIMPNSNVTREFLGSDNVVQLEGRDFVGEGYFRLRKQGGILWH